MGAAENKQLVLDYFEKLRTGSPDLPDLLADDVRWWVPPGSRMAGSSAGKAAVLDFMRRGVALYDPDVTIAVAIEQLVAEDDWVACQLVIEARTARGADYCNHYHFAFQIRDGRIALVKEYLDTKVAHDAFFP